MTTSTRSKSTPGTGALLTTKELEACKRIASGAGASAQRAAALLALQAGDTQVQAAKKGGLTTGQVKYWAARFRNQRLAIFPEAVKQAGKGDAAAEGSRLQAKATAEPGPEAKGGTKSTKKGKKAGQVKKEKKVKKDKKGKEDKKGKKDKKKDKKKGGKGKKK